MGEIQSKYQPVLLLITATVCLVSRLLWVLSSQKRVWMCLDEVYGK